jgi:hypothetical protein
MDKDGLFSLYEKLYFHEIEVREKLTGRLQLPLAILVGELGLIGYMLSNKTNVAFSYYICAFWSFYILSCASVLAAIYYFIRSWHGYEYSFIPSPSAIDVYRCQLIEFYTDDEEKEILVKSALKNFLYDYYCKCSSKNTDNNDRRSITLHKTSTFLIVSVVLLFCSFIPFYFGNFDKANRPQAVIISAPIEIIETRLTSEETAQVKNTMVERLKSQAVESVDCDINNKRQTFGMENAMTDKTKSPPPPPPVRVIKEDAPSTPSSGGNGGRATSK